MDGHVCAVRDSMLKEGVLARVDREDGRRLVRSTPKESQLERVRRERRERQAQAA